MLWTLVVAILAVGLLLVLVIFVKQTAIPSLKFRKFFGDWPLDCNHRLRKLQVNTVNRVMREMAGDLNSFCREQDKFNRDNEGEGLDSQLKREDRRIQRDIDRAQNKFWAAERLLEHFFFVYEGASSDMKYTDWLQEATPTSWIQAPPLPEK